MPHHRNPDLSPEMHAAAHLCEDCHDVCIEAFQHCLKRGGELATLPLLSVLLDCSAICHTGTDFLLRGSTLHAHVCTACVAVCEACATSCERMPSDEVLTTCAATCRQCAESCRTMAG